ncbi:MULTISPECIES: hypothetical protein [Microbacterium]|uniref:hypothetical protein n=1 Tax=Microbacterium TaxID=33882 RepID=UPI002781EDB7|nr:MULTISPECIES: hypothetical protein [Microbacterium]MDQ1084562.1 hypothetical protein [Microbacterium sp. SORGH_AS_0344]MDQ1170160.1 hypothetical protein [Microbacterium proteolyticum]
MRRYGTDIADAPAEPVDIGADVSASDTTDYADEPADLAEAPPELDAPEIDEAPPAGDLSDPAADESDAASEMPADAEERVDLGESPVLADEAREQPQEWQEGEVVDVGHGAVPDAPLDVMPAESDDLGAPDLGAPEGTDAREGEISADSDGVDSTAPAEEGMYGDSQLRDAPTEDMSDADTAHEHSLADGDVGLAESEPDTPDVEAAAGTDLPEEQEITELGSEVESESLSEVADADAEPSVDELTEAARDEARPADELRTDHDADVADALADDPPADSRSAEVEEVPATEANDLPVVHADLGNSPENEALTSALAEKGLSLESVYRFDYSDNPVLGYRESAPPEDIAYAVNAWNDHVAPGIASGATREDFAAYDQEHGLGGHEQLAGVYDYMLGNDAIKSGGEREDGSLDVTGGRHRLEQARLNGVQYLPVRK